MAHPYAKHKEMHPGKARVHKIYAHKKHGGHVEGSAYEEAHESAAEAKKERRHEHKATGGPAKPRLDKYARGGKTKGGHKGHHTKINIMVAPKGGDGAGAGGMPPPGGPPPGLGGPPPGGPPPGMPPGGPMGAAPPPGAGGLPPGLPPPPGGGMKRGGSVKPGVSGISSPKNLAKWSKHASSNTKYADGGGVPHVHMKGGAGGAQGRLDKKAAYGIKSHARKD